MFSFPPIIDTKIDQPQAEIVIDHDKVAALGLNMQQVGADLSAMIGGNFVNRFNIAGRSYKVIPQIKRVDRLNPSQLEDIYVTGPNGKLIPLSTIATIQQQDRSALAQPVAAAQCGQDQRRCDRPARSGARSSSKTKRQDSAEGLLGRLHRRIAPTARRGQQVPARALASPSSSSFSSSRRSSTVSAIRFIILFGSVPLAMFGALIFTFLKMPNPNIPFFTNGWTTTMNIYSQVGLVTLVGLISKNGILIVEFANKLQREGLDKVAAVAQAARDALAPGPDDDDRDRCRSLSARPRDRRRRRGA